MPSDGIDDDFWDPDPPPRDPFGEVHDGIYDLRERLREMTEKLSDIERATGSVPLALQERLVAMESRINKQMQVIVWLAGVAAACAAWLLLK